VQSNGVHDDLFGEGSIASDAVATNHRNVPMRFGQVPRLMYWDEVVTTKVCFH
jgi:hypothetical protein